ncbi:MAG: metallophosphoesterase [Nitrospirota bacterium]
MIIMILTLTGITLVRRVCSRKIFIIFLLALLVGCGGGNVNSGGSSDNSNGNGSSVDNTPPSAPTGLFTQSVSSRQISISWSASTDDKGVAGYYVYRNNAQISTAANTSYQDANLLPSTTYSYKIAAYDAAGNISQQSAALNVTTQAETAACSDNTFSFALFSDNYSGQEGGLRRVLNEVVSKDSNIRFLASAGDTPPYERVRGIIDAELSDALNCGASEFPWFPATGNHDSEVQSYMDWWAANWANGWTTNPAASRLATQLPGIHNFKRGPLQIQTASGIINADYGTMYSFDYKNVHFIYIDNYEQGVISDTAAGAWDLNGSSVFDPAVSQLDWLKDDLEQNTKPIAFVFGHVAMLAPCYNYDPPISYYNCPGPPPPLWSEHNSNFHTVELTKLLADYDVVAYFHGHDHVPSRMLINSSRTSAFERLYWAAANDPNKPYGTPSDWEGLQGPGRVWQVDGGAVYTNIGEYIIVKLNDAEIRFEIYKYPNNTQGSTELWDTWSVPIAPYCTANGGC